MLANYVNALLGAALFRKYFPPRFKEIVMTALRRSMIDAMLLRGKVAVIIFIRSFRIHKWQFRRKRPVTNSDLSEIGLR